jgi:hypothetical protein
MSVLNGIWCGKNATVAIVDDFTVSFLRIQHNTIASILRHRDYGTVGAVYGIGVNFDAHAVYCSKNPDTGAFFYNVIDGKNNLENHSNDIIEYDETSQNLIYTMYDGKKFNLVSAEKIDMAIFERKNPVDNTLTVAERMALWGVNKYFEYRDGYFNVGIDTEKYSIYFYFSVTDKHVYCRVGQNGYCEKGRAMLSTVCIRQNECRMLENNLLTINEYKPMEECFVADSCAFPSDGGWYWSIKKVTDDVIYLHGCGGATYEIHRK